MCFFGPFALMNRRQIYIFFSVMSMMQMKNGEKGWHVVGEAPERFQYQSLLMINALYLTRRFLFIVSFPFLNQSCCLIFTDIFIF